MEIVSRGGGDANLRLTGKGLHERGYPAAGGQAAIVERGTLQMHGQASVECKVWMDVTRCR